MSFKKTNFFKEFLSYFFIIILAIVFSISVRIFIFEPFIVPTPSMEPTLVVGDKVIVNKLAYKTASIKKGDLVVFHSLIVSKDLVKRAIALEGDKIALTDNGDIYINNKKIAEDYLPENYNITYSNQTLIVGEGKVFVMGDNRNDSYDSRYFGPISEEEIFGKVVFIYLPLSRLRTINNS